MRTARQLAWLAGLFEGEGCIGLSHQGRPTMIISMTDEDVIRRAHEIAGVGHVRVRPKKTAGDKQMWVFLVGRCDDAVALLETLFVFFGDRRRARAIEVIESYKAAPLARRPRTHCHRGHPFGEPVFYSSPARTTWERKCRPCGVIRTQRYRARKRLRAAAEMNASGIFTLA